MNINISRSSNELGDALGDNYDFRQEIPWLNFPSDVSVKVIFPAAGAYARFLVKPKGNSKGSISVYLDTRRQLGAMNSPYWEAYPIKDDCRRFMLSEGKKLVDCIVRELRKNKKKP